MKKINVKVLTLAFMILSMLTAGGLAIRNTIAPGGTGFGPDDHPEP